MLASRPTRVETRVRASAELERLQKALQQPAVNWRQRWSSKGKLRVLKWVAVPVSSAPGSDESVPERIIVEKGVKMQRPDDQPSEEAVQSANAIASRLNTDAGENESGDADNTRESSVSATREGSPSVNDDGSPLPQVGSVDDVVSDAEEAVEKSVETEAKEEAPVEEAVPAADTAVDADVATDVTSADAAAGASEDAAETTTAAGNGGDAMDTTD